VERLAELLDSLATAEGVNSTRLEGVSIYKTSETRPREPLCYSQGIIIMAQGSKRVYLEEQVYDYNPHNYLVLTLPIPAECETLVEPGKPLLALMIDIDLGVLHELVRLLDEHRQLPDYAGQLKQCKSLYVSQVTAPLNATLLRLAECLRSPLQCDVLGKSLLRELLFLMLLAPDAGPLYALALHNTHLARLEKALKHMHDHYHETLDVAQLASLANMSPPSFHRTFRQVTASSPIQYLKKLRLSKARELLLDQGIKVKQAAAQVGYESPTQFSREFKRYFGQSPQNCFY